MEEDPRSSGIVAVTIMDEEVKQEREQEPPHEARKERFYEVRERAVAEVLSDFDRINNLKHLDKHSSDRQQQVGSSGFYKVPEDMRRRAGREEAALYDPKHVNLRKIRELFEKDDPGDVRTRNQLMHYDYHLRSYANWWSWLHDIKGLVRKLFVDFEETVAWPTVDMIIGSGSSVIRANMFLGDLFQRSLEGELSATDDPECALLWASELWSDLLLLDNQIPLLFVGRTARINIYKPVLLYFADFIPLNALECFFRESCRGTNFHHILHLIHDMLLPATSHSKPGSHPLAWFWSPKEAAPPSTMKPVPTVTRLQQAGIKFKPVDEAGFVVEFKRGVLKLPRLHITKCTKKVLMNLIAWEICHPEAAKYFINYAIFMDHLINTSKDVEILVQSGVFEHSLATDEEVASLFNALTHDLVYTKNALEKNKRYDIFPQLSLDIKKHCKSRRNEWLANLMQDYFKSPWAILSLIAALFLILLTMEQSFFSAYSYFRPPK